MKVKYSLIVVVVLFAAGLLFAVSSEAVIEPENIAGMWLFNDGGGDVAEDSSGNGNDGELINNPEWDTGKFGDGLAFDGLAAHVNAGNGPSLDIPEEITIMAWVQFDGVDYQNSGGGLFSIGAKGYPDSLSPHAGWWFSHDNRGNGQSFNYTCFGNKNGGWAGGGNNFGTHSFQFTNGQWYHLALTVAESIARLYVDGTQIGAEKTFSNLVLSDTTMDLTIGSAGTSWQFNGIIDEFAIFNIELGEREIQNIMNDGLERAVLVAVEPSGKLTRTWADIKAR
jgi:hypothetical protein